MNHSQRNLKKLIRAKEDSIADEELFLSAAYQKYQTSLARAVTGRYRYGLQVLLDWDISEQAGVAYTDNYKVHLNAANPITQSFPTRFLRSQSLTGLTGHEVGHLLYSDFTAHAVHLRSLENGSFYPKEPELSLPAYQTALEEIKEVLEEKDKAGCLTLARCAATFQNILEDIHIEDRMCEEFHGTFRQGIELNNLMDMCDRNGNRDGAALRFVAEHLCTRPELQKLLILISDGQPADYGYSGTEAEADLRGIKKEYEKRDVILFAAAIGDDKENIRRIYKDGFLDITKLEELPKNMAQLVKQHLK